MTPAPASSSTRVSGLATRLPYKFSTYILIWPAFQTECEPLWLAVEMFRNRLLTADLFQLPASLLTLQMEVLLALQIVQNVE